MANTKKYVSLDKLGLYDEKIKKVITDGDAASLQSAKDYADGLAGNYEAAGNVATAKSELQGKIDAVEGKADAAQGEVDALETYVGTFTASEGVDTVVKYIDAKTANIASDAALAELAGKVSANEGAIDAIEADYLKAADKNELSKAISDEATRADTAEKANAAAIKAISDDYLKAADKTELQGNIDAVAEDVAEIAGDYLTSDDKAELEGKINAKAAQTALDEEVTRAKGAEEGLQNQINTIMSNPDAEGAINSINEFTQYVADHGTIADGFRTDINKNKDDIAEEVKRAGNAESALSGRLDTLEAINHEAYVAADTALKNELNGEIAKKADQTALESAVQALEGADAGLGNRITTLENKFTGEGSVESQIGTAKQEAIDAAAADATSKANTAEANAKSHADGLNTAMNARVEALEAIDHEHSNKALLDTYTQTEANLADAVSKKHAHTNFEVLEGITSAKVTAWDAAEGNAKAYTDAEVLKDRTRLDTIEAWHANFVEVSEEEINALFE